MTNLEKFPPFVTPEQRVKEILEAYQRVEWATLARERALNETRWFDYRFSSPLQLTHLFRKLYQDVYQQHHGKNFDFVEGQRKRGFRGGDTLKNQKEFTAFWHARSFADELGIEYRCYIDECMKLHLRNGYRRVPYINQLYGENGPKIATTTGLKWLEWQNTRFLAGRRPEYLNESYFGFPAQDAHRKWAIEQIKARANAEAYIAVSCHERRILPADIARREFGDEKLEYANLEAKTMTPVPPNPVSKGDIWPSCFGLPGAYDVLSCKECPAAERCQRLEAMMCERFKSRNSEDPVLMKKRKQVRDRVRRHRAKKRAANLNSYLSSKAEPATAECSGKF